jgi:hypothetical protein
MRALAVFDPGAGYAGNVIKASRLTTKPKKPYWRRKRHA